MPLRGALRDDALQAIQDAAIAVDDEQHVMEVGSFQHLHNSYTNAEVVEIEPGCIALPSYVDAHTHICYAGTRAKDYALRNSGVSYQEIQNQGGGIWSTVVHTRTASQQQLADAVVERANKLCRQGITCIEVKSGYGLSVQDELKQLRAIAQAKLRTKASLLPTCLAAHICPAEFKGEAGAYLNTIVHELLPQLQAEQLTHRIDLFAEPNAFPIEIAGPYLQKAKQLGFDLTIHADQFTRGGSQLAVQLHALSADHLEASGEYEIKMLGASETVAVALPGASLGLGMQFSPARALLDANAILAIATDWNPGSAPMGNLVAQAAILGAYEKLSTAELLAAITYRAAHALGLRHAGRIAPGLPADFVVYNCASILDIFYNQGQLLPKRVFKHAELVATN